MNDATTTLLFDVVARLERAIQARACPAMVLLDGSRRLVMSDYDYLRGEAEAVAFERRAAVKAREIDAVRWVLAVPQVWTIKRDAVFSRPVSNVPLEPGEEEAITWASYDCADGVDYGRVLFTRRPNGEPVFAEPEMFVVGIKPADHTTPGFTLIHALLDDDSKNDGR